jgi:hypothetical protein
LSCRPFIECGEVYGHELGPTQMDQSAVTVRCDSTSRAKNDGVFA